MTFVVENSFTDGPLSGRVMVMQSAKLTETFPARVFGVPGEARYERVGAVENGKATYRFAGWHFKED